MPDEAGPGPLVEGAPGAIRSIAAAATATTAFLGESERGPTRPTLVTDLAAFERTFGGRLREDHYLPDALAGFFGNGGRRAFVCRVCGDGAVAASGSLGGLRLSAAGPGRWGNRLLARVGAPPAPSQRFALQIAYWPVMPPGVSLPDPFDPAHPPNPAPAIVEAFDGLVWDDEWSPDFCGTRLAEASSLVRIDRQGPLAHRPEPGIVQLAGGEDGTDPAAADFAGDHEDPEARTGLAALDLDACREVALIAAPAAPPDLIDLLIAHCERNRFRFALLDCEPGQTNAASLDPRGRWDSSHAAFYYPWIDVGGAIPGQPRLVPPCGHVAGIFARVDAERGVFKAPANEAVRGALAVEFPVSQAMQDLLNSRGVNVIRSFPGRGIRLWGARTLSTNPLWQYVAVRRLLMVVEHSLQDGTAWVVFEPNVEATWQKVRDEVRQFLHGIWRAGGLMGKTPDEAYRIACDRSTMSEDDLANGRLICEIGLAPIRPAEFVIFRFQQRTAEALS